MRPRDATTTTQRKHNDKHTRVFSADTKALARFVRALGSFRDGQYCVLPCVDARHGANPRRCFMQSIPGAIVMYQICVRCFLGARCSILQICNCCSKEQIPGHAQPRVRLKIAQAKICKERDTTNRTSSKMRRQRAQPKEAHKPQDVRQNDNTMCDTTNLKMCDNMITLNPRCATTWSHNPKMCDIMTTLPPRCATNSSQTQMCATNTRIP